MTSHVLHVIWILKILFVEVSPVEIFAWMQADTQQKQDPIDLEKQHATTFSPFWNEIIKSLREEDYISHRYAKRQ